MCVDMGCLAKYCCLGNYRRHFKVVNIKYVNNCIRLLWLMHENSNVCEKIMFRYTDFDVTNKNVNRMQYTSSLSASILNFRKIFECESVSQFNLINVLKSFQNDLHQIRHDIEVTMKVVRVQAYLNQKYTSVNFVSFYVCFLKMQVILPPLYYEIQFCMDYYAIYFVL